ncbi:MAG: hypothetical protein K2P87_16450 [Lachnospiraceae bacterium]|nr:hypothetical protein [Lachnospiraceae bacterium]
MANVGENNALILGMLAKGIITARGSGGSTGEEKEDTFGFLEYKEILDAGVENFIVLGEGLVGYPAGGEEENTVAWVFGEMAGYSVPVPEKEDCFAGIADVVDAYRYYLYFGYGGAEYLFLSNDTMAVMVNYYGDEERQAVDIPAPYRPVNAVAGTQYRRMGGAWELEKQDVGIAKAFHLSVAVPAWEFVGRMAFVYSNYDVVMYHNDPSGNISEVGRIMAWDVR